MLNCREVSRWVSESFERPLPWRVRFAVWFHLAMCGVCYGFLRMVRRIDREVRQQAGRLDDPLAGNEGLSSQARARLDDIVRRSLRE